MTPALQQILHEITVRLTKLEETFAQPKNDCTRSHPHEEMSKECELRTEIARLRNQLAQPEQEPVFWYKPYPNGMYNGPIHNAQIGNVLRGSEEWTPLYATPPQRTWVGLKEKEIDQGLVRTNYAMQIANAWRDGVAWAQLQLKEKNT